MKKIKITTSIVIIIILIFSMTIPLFAAEPTSGKCGENATWSYNSSNGVLTITGNGEIEDYYNNGDYFAPWCRLEIKSVIIGNGITRIGNDTFSFCDEIVEIQIPDSVLSIGNYAFYECSSLENITIPDSVIYIEYDIFYNCISLKNIVIPDSVTTANISFEGCTSLEKVTLSNNISEMPSFGGCINLKEINIPENVNLIGQGTFKDCISLKNITIPDSCVTITSEAFENTALFNDDENWDGDVLYIDNHLIKAKTTINGTYEMKKGTKSIAYRAFEGCTELTGIKIPDSVFSVGTNAFLDTGFYNNQNNWDGDALYVGSHLIATKEEISGTYNIKPGTKIIAACTFYCRENLTEVTIPNSVINIGLAAFIGCTGIKSIKLPNSVTNIERAAFSYCDLLEEINIPNKIKRINYSTFSQNPNLKNITMPNSVTSIGQFAFELSGLESISFSESISSIESYAFRYCENLKSVTFSGDIKSMAGNAFNDCTGLDTIIFNGNEKDWETLKTKIREISPIHTAKITISEKKSATNEAYSTTTKTIITITETETPIWKKRPFWLSAIILLGMTFALSFITKRKNKVKGL